MTRQRRQMTRKRLSLPWHQLQRKASGQEAGHQGRGKQVFLYSFLPSRSCMLLHSVGMPTSSCSLGQASGFLFELDHHTEFIIAGCGV